MPLADASVTEWRPNSAIFKKLVTGVPLADASVTEWRTESIMRIANVPVPLADASVTEWRIYCKMIFAL